jgi:Fuc2NAc and GlcNAc transferase
LLDRPTARSSHSRETPKGGGIGITAAFVATAAVLGLPAAFWLPLAALSILALRGDQVNIPPRLRLSLQLLLAGILVVGTDGGKERGLPGLLLVLFWIVFIVGTANFYNFMDGIDGIAGVSGVIAFGMMALATWQVQPGVGLLAACLALACAGFLPFNLPRARVFMGDAGSILLGSVFAGLVFLAAPTFLDFICLAALLFPFYCDELTTMAVRMRDGENLTRPHRRHVYQLLVNELHVAQWRVAAGYGLLQLLLGASVLSARAFGAAAVLAVLASWFALLVICGSCVRKRALDAGTAEGR